MSCLDKLKFLPSLSPIDKVSKALAPSVVGNLPLTQRIALATQGVTSIAKNIVEQVTAEVNNAINAITGNIAATVGAIKGAPSRLLSLKGSFVKAFTDTANALKEQAKSVGDVIKCEITSLQDNNILITEATELQSSVNAAAAATAGGISNNLAKTLSQDPAKKQAYINAQATNVQAKTIQSVATTKNNKTVQKQQSQAVTKIEALPAKQPNQEASIQKYITTNKKYTKQERINILRQRKQDLILDGILPSQQQPYKDAIDAEIKRLENAPWVIEP